MTAPTDRLHYEDPRALAFEARVIERTERGVVLDRSAFYPESGGQLGDHGTLRTAAGLHAVTDTQLRADGCVVHTLEGSPPALDSAVHGQVDEVRRREHMALHSGQHALSRALLDTLGAVTVSSRLGASACTLDVDRAPLELADVRRAEAQVNALIAEDRPVTQRFVTASELEALALRKPAPDTERVRVVGIEGFDDTPCGGTHVTSTAQIQLLFIHGLERYKGGTRITFEAGPRARRLLVEESDRLRAAAAEQRCAPAELSEILAGVREKLERARRESGELRAQLADRWADELAAPLVIAELPGADPTLLKLVAARLTERPCLVALAAPGEEGAHVIVARGEGRTESAGALLKEIAKASGGRGGGRPELAQGRVPAGLDWDAVVRAALDEL